jgi:hypothetical protein
MGNKMLFNLSCLQTNINNQVVKVGEQDLITVQSSAMTKMLAATQSLPQAPSQERSQDKGNQNVQDILPAT